MMIISFWKKKKKKRNKTKQKRLHSWIQIFKQILQTMGTKQMFHISATDFICWSRANAAQKSDSRVVCKFVCF